MSIHMQVAFTNRHRYQSGFLQIGIALNGDFRFPKCFLDTALSAEIEIWDDLAERFHSWAVVRGMAKLTTPRKRKVSHQQLPSTLQRPNTNPLSSCVDVQLLLVLWILAYQTN